MYQLLYLQVWFQNRRAKWRKKEHTKKGPGRPAHNAQPQTCSGEPMDPDEVKRKEIERMEKKKRKQEERLRKLEEKRHLIDTDDISSSKAHSENMSSDAENESVDNHKNSDINESSDNEKRPVCSFSIDRLLEEPRVPRGRRPNSKYPRVQACKSITSLGAGMMPLYPVTQPIGFVVEQRQDEIKSDSDTTEHNMSSDEALNDSSVNGSSVFNDYSKPRNVDEDYDADINVTDDENEVYSEQLKRNNISGCLDLTMPISA